MTIRHQREGTYISNQVRMLACHLTSKYCKYFLIVTGKILKEKESTSLVIRKNKKSLPLKKMR